MTDPGRSASPLPARSATFDRDTEVVVRDHMHCRARGSVESDIQRNYDADVVLISGAATFRGLAGAVAVEQRLAQELGDAAAALECRLLRVEMGLAYLEWGASVPDLHCDGVDTYVVAHGRIVAQTTCCCVRRGGADPMVDVARGLG